MQPVIQVLARGWELFWSVFPKNFYFLILLSALCEAISIVLFKLSGNRGPLVIAGYILGFFVVAFYAEAIKYSRVSHSYPVWLVSAAILVTVASVFVLHEKVSFLWLAGFVLAIVGLIMINLSLPPES